MNNYPLEDDLRWAQVLDNINKAYLAASDKKRFDALARIQEAEIILRAIAKQEEINNYHG